MTRNAPAERKRQVGLSSTREVLVFYERELLVKRCRVSNTNAAIDRIKRTSRIIGGVCRVLFGNKGRLTSIVNLACLRMWATRWRPSTLMAWAAS